MKRLALGLIMVTGVCIGAPGNGMPSAAPGGTQPMSQQGRMPQSPTGGRGGAYSSSRQGTMSSRRNSGQSRERRSDSDELSESDQKLLEQIEEAESMKAISRLSQNARSSRTAEVRQAMVEALAKHGEDALDYLAEYIADSDNEVAGAAFNAWAEILGNMDRSERIRAISAAARVLVSAGMYGGGRGSANGMPRNNWRSGEYPASGSGQRQGEYPARGNGQRTR